MLSRSVQHKLGLVFGSMILLHAVVFWQEWPWIPIGFPDFSIFYTAGKILKQGQATELYDDRLQERVQKSFAPTAVARRGSILPFNHPPFEALFFVPFTAFSFLTAYFAWLVINSVILVSALLLLRRNLRGFQEVPPWLCLMMGFGFFPAYVALVQGQDSIWVFFCYVMAFTALRRDADFTAGSWLGLGLCKFHLVLPFVAILLVLRRFRAFLGFSLAAICLGLVGFAAVGWQGILRYPGYVLWTDRAAKYRWNFVHGNNPNLRALILSLSPHGDNHPAQALIAAGSIMLLGSAAWYWRRALLLQTVSKIRSRDSTYQAPTQHEIEKYPNSSPQVATGESLADQWRQDAVTKIEPHQGRHTVLQFGMALSVTATLLVSYHTWVQDMTIILLPLFLLLDVQLRRKIANGRWLWVIIAILFCSPVYMLLLLRFSQFRVMALVLLAFFVASVIALKRLPAARAQPA